MRMIISTAKKMRTDTDSFVCRGLPVFMEQTEQLCARLREMSGGDIYVFIREPVFLEA